MVCLGAASSSFAEQYPKIPGSEEKNLPAYAGDTRDAGLIPGLGRSRGEGNGNPLQYSCLENPMDGGAWQARVHMVAKSRTRLKRLSSSSSSRCYCEGFSGGSDSKESACGAGEQGSIPGSGRSRGEGNGNPLQYSCLENPMGGGVWQATVYGVAKSRTRLSDFTFTFSHVR